MKKLLLLIILTLSVGTVAATEEKDSLFLWGWPCDAFTMKPVIDSTRAELMTLDSVVIATATPFWDRYTPNSRFVIKVGFRSGEYLIRLTNPKYETTTKRFKIKVKRYEDDYMIGTIKMRHAPKIINLDEAVVTATKIKFYTKGDTISITPTPSTLPKALCSTHLWSSCPVPN